MCVWATAGLWCPPSQFGCFWQSLKTETRAVIHVLKLLAYWNASHPYSQSKQRFSIFNLTCRTLKNPLNGVHLVKERLCKVTLIRDVVNVKLVHELTLELTLTARAAWVNIQTR